MKRFFTAVLTAVFLSGTAVLADEEITVYSNGNLVEDSGIIIEGRTFVPVRGVFEYLGYTVDWQADTKTAVLTSSGSETVVSLTEGEDFFTVNGESITPDVPQQIINGKFMLPLRSIGNAIGAKVGWNEETKTATINADNNFITINPVDEDNPIIDEMPVNEITAE
ncbi:MAG: copper amine oxidase N-terminal domain-containing protein [Clostridiales bacterium]|nr:copper amine oxidase N-terminal domain-containing protein [Clostridiales bacterium]